MTFERHGGFGGVVLRTTFTHSELTEPEAEAIAAVQQGASSEQRGDQPDRFEYHLDLPGGRVVIHEGDVPEPLRPLVTRLLERARELGCYQVRSRSDAQHTANHRLKLGLGFAASPHVRTLEGGEERPGFFFVKVVGAED